MINQGRTAFLSAPLLQGMLEGGVPIIVDGHCVGAVGVSGVKSTEDAQVARAGIAALVGCRRLSARPRARGPAGPYNPPVYPPTPQPSETPPQVSPRTHAPGCAGAWR